MTSNHHAPYGLGYTRTTMAPTDGSEPARGRRKAGMTSNHHAPYGLGYTRTTMAPTDGSEPARGSKTEKRRPSSD